MWLPSFVDPFVGTFRSGLRWGGSLFADDATHNKLAKRMAHFQIRTLVNAALSLEV